MEPAPIVIDNGSGWIKAGFAIEDQVKPGIEFPSIVGRMKSGGPKSSCFVGHKALDMARFSTLEYPIKKGVVQNWDDIEAVWKYTFSDRLEYYPSHHPVLITQSSFMTDSDKIRAASIMFEKFNVPKFSNKDSAILALYTTGQTTGLVVDIGDETAHAVPVLDGIIDKSAVSTLDFGGRRVTDYLQQLMVGVSNEFSNGGLPQHVQHIKETLCCVSLDFDKELVSNELSTTYELPDGEEITIATERIKAPEVLFTPEKHGYKGSGIHQLAYDSLSKYEKGTEKETALAQNIVLAGASTMFRDFEKRFQLELDTLVKGATAVNVVAHPKRKWLSWIGGSMLASSSSFNGWITKEEYREIGPNVALQK